MPEQRTDTKGQKDGERNVGTGRNKRREIEMVENAFATDTHLISSSLAYLISLKFRETYTALIYLLSMEASPAKVFVSCSTFHFRRHKSFSNPQYGHTTTNLHLNKLVIQSWVPASLGSLAL